MNITEALEKGNGKARLSGFDDCYVGEGNDGVLTWFNALGKKEYRVTYEQLVLTAWLPYQPEPEKCEVCKEADEIMMGHSFMSPTTDRYCAHLKKYHCSCKGGA